MNYKNCKVQLSDIINETRKQYLQREMELKPLNILKDEIEIYNRSISQSNINYSENNGKNFKKSLNNER